MIRQVLAQVSGCRPPPQLLHCNSGNWFPSLQSLLIPPPISSTVPLTQANTNVLSVKSMSAFKTQLCFEPMLLPLLSKSICTWDHGGGPVPCLSESTVDTHALFRRQLRTAECPTPYQDPIKTPAVQLKALHFSYSN